MTSSDEMNKSCAYIHNNCSGTQCFKVQCTEGHYRSSHHSEAYSGQGTYACDFISMLNLQNRTTIVLTLLLDGKNRHGVSTSLDEQFYKELCYY